MSDLVVEDLAAGYGRRLILDGLSTTFPKGQSVALIGHNGAGKSTLIKALTGVIRPRAGRVIFGGDTITGMPPEVCVKRGIVHVPAGRRVFPRLTVRQNLQVGAYARRDKAAVERELEGWLETFPILKARLGEPASVMSGGEQQMLVIARGLMARPKILFVDEPSLGLSPVMVDQVFEILKTLAQSDVTLILAEQNVRKALEITQFALILAQGQVTRQMASAELASDAEFRASYLGAGTKGAFASVQ
ncbi:MAG: ABC transporter ATP-binding protein [Pseudomonadota bacterium]